jgi:parallel beta-helix repeat protein
MKLIYTCLIFLFSGFIHFLVANTFYADPEHGNMTNPGSISSPWGTFQEIIENNLIESRMWTEHPPGPTTQLVIKNEGAPIKAGDTLMLLNGYHGVIELIEYFNTAYITVMAAPGQNPEIASLRVVGGSYWRFSGLTISPEFTGSPYRTTLVDLESHGWRGPVTNCIVENCTMYSVENAGGWTREQWDTLSSSGIGASGDEFVIRNNYLKNVNFGISVSGNRSTVCGNTIENFAGDGLRGLGNDLLFEYNTVKNCYDVNENHDDGFQSWSINDDPPRERVTLRGNVIICYEDENQPFRGTLQGIGCFDGPYVDWVVENNVVITDHWHGISLYGARNCRIINNTVIDPNQEDPGPPWIGFFDHKNGTHSENCIIRNNIATNYIVEPGSTEDHNLEITFAEYGDYFTDWRHFNVDLIDGCNAIDAGSMLMAPSTDAGKRIRPFGKGIDIGAYEYGSYIMDSSGTNIPGNYLINYPNPFSDQTVISYSLEETTYVNLIIYDVTGRKITSLVRSIESEGPHSSIFIPGTYHLASGIYYGKLTTARGVSVVDLVYVE